MKKRGLIKKIILGFTGMFVLLIIALLVFKSTWIGAIKNTVTGMMSEMTKSKVSVDDFSLSFLQGKLTINKVDIGNPKGYHTATALGFNDLTIDLDPGSLLEDTIVIEEITINGLAVTLETGITSNNLNDIKANIDSYLKKDKAEPAPEPTEEKKAEKPGKKFIIKQININNGQITLATKYLKGPKVPLKLANIKLENIGNNSQGADPAEVADKLITAIYESTMKVVDESDVITQEGKNFFNNIKSNTNKVIDSIKSLF